MGRLVPWILMFLGRELTPRRACRGLPRAELRGGVARSLSGVIRHAGVDRVAMEAGGRWKGRRRGVGAAVRAALAHPAPCLRVLVSRAHLGRALRGRWRRAGAPSVVLRQGEGRRTGAPVLRVAPPLRRRGARRRPHARPAHALKELFNLGRRADEVLGPEAVARVFNQLDEGDEQAPGVRPVHDEALHQHAGDLLLDLLRPGLLEEAEEHAGEVVRVVVGEAQLVGQGVEEQVAPLRVELARELLVNVHGRRV
mmetsp:Transcript_10128/g.29888  ORF Transcript_10128/g.29888 Transcript_10128/m.29888 type:complete len:254 (-) Transcript_10128:1041-1802(-)